MHLDTHVLVWLYAGEFERLPPVVLDRLGRSPLLASPIVKLELQLLHEIGRIDPPASVLVDDLTKRLGLRRSLATWGKAVEQATSLSWTRDPFDRLIAAHALADGDTLLTRDRRMHEHLPNAVWD